jgi:hypothetical protein
LNRPASRNRRADAPRLKCLKGQEVDTYAGRAAALVSAGRMNKWFPDPFGCAGYFTAIAAAVAERVYDGVQIDLASGLPVFKDLLTIQVDREVAPPFLAEQEIRAAAGIRPSSKLQAKLAYYRRLVQSNLPPLNRLDVKLRRIDRARTVSMFEVVFDRYQLDESVFVRYTLVLEQRDSVPGRPFLERSGDYSQQTAAFREKMETYTQDDSEIAFLLVGKLEGVRVLEVTRGRIGPLWSPWTPAPPGWLAAGTGDSAFVLHLPLDRASVELDKDRDNDPFSTIFRKFLSDSSRSLVEEEARRLGYRVHKERKFVCTAAVADVIRERLREAGTQNIVYTI